MPRVGQRYAQFEIVRLLGEGGMGEVYEGYDHKLERRVAIKAIRAEARLAGEIRARFLREARVLGKLAHPGICEVHDFLETPDTDLLVLEFVEGQTLRERSLSGLSQPELLGLMAAVADALAAAHGQGVVHRDLKPDNIMVQPDGAVRILDFGIAVSLRGAAEERPLTPRPVDPDAPTVRGGAVAMSPLAGVTPTPGVRDGPSAGDRLTHAGAVLGTEGYMSPEQSAGAAVGTASDLYGFGVILARQLPRCMPSVSPDAPGQAELRALLARLTATAPNARPTAAEAALELRRILSLPLEARRQRTRRGLVALSLVVLALFSAGMSWLAWQAREAQRQSQLRQQRAEALIDFIYTDLYRGLEPLGRPDLLSRVSARTLDYFEGLPEDSLSLPELRNRIGTHFNLLATQHLLGQPETAARTLARTGQLIEAGRARAPDDPALARHERLRVAWTVRLAQTRQALTEADRRALDAALAAALAVADDSAETRAERYALALLAAEVHAEVWDLPAARQALALATRHAPAAPEGADHDPDLARRLGLGARLLLLDGPATAQAREAEAARAAAEEWAGDADNRVGEALDLAVGIEALQAAYWRGDAIDEEDFDDLWARADDLTDIEYNHVGWHRLLEQVLRLRLELHAEFGDAEWTREADEDLTEALDWMTEEERRTPLASISRARALGAALAAGDGLPPKRRQALGRESVLLLRALDETAPAPTSADAALALVHLRVALARAGVEADLTRARGELDGLLARAAHPRALADAAWVAGRLGDPAAREAHCTALRERGYTGLLERAGCG